MLAAKYVDLSRKSVNKLLRYNINKIEKSVDKVKTFEGKNRLIKIAKEILILARSMCPIDTGALIKSGRVIDHGDYCSVTFGDFDKVHYATYVETMIGLNHPRGGKDNFLFDACQIIGGLEALSSTYPIAINYSVGETNGMISAYIYNWKHNKISGVPGNNLFTVGRGGGGTYNIKIPASKGTKRSMLISGIKASINDFINNNINIRIADRLKEIGKADLINTFDEVL